MHKISLSFCNENYDNNKYDGVGGDMVEVVMMKTTTMIRLKRWTEGAPENEIVRLCERMRIQ